MLPKDMSPAQHLFNIRNKKTHGTCIMCQQETPWNEQTEKYERLCSSTCKEEYREMFKNRMMDKHGKVHLLNDPIQQRKMLENRKISGKYKWSDGKEIVYTGSYEHDFLKFLDLVMNFSSNDVICPAPQTFYYTMSDGIKRFYVPDMFIPSLNLLLEIKDGGSNPNKHPKIQQVDKAKEREKDKVMKMQKKHHYLKVTDKNYSSFLNFLVELKNQDKGEENIQPIVRISETYNYLTKFQKTVEDEYYKLNETYDERFIRLLNTIDIDNMLSENNIVDPNVTISKMEKLNTPSTSFGLPNERKFLMESVEDLKKTMKSFRFCEKTKRKELARNIYKRSQELNVTIPKVNPIWSHIDIREQVEMKPIVECDKIGKDRFITYDNIPENLDIAELINSCDKVWISSDYHLFTTKRKNLSMKQKVNNVNELIQKYHNQLVSDNDVFIFLGDLVNDEFENKEALKKFIQTLKGRKILVLGNNDVFENEFYYECGFEHVVDSFRYENILFTHHPVNVEEDGQYNIHGHIHFSKQYYDIKYNGHIDACCDAHGFKPMELHKMIELQREGYYTGTTIFNGDFTLVNKLNEETEYQKFLNKKDNASDLSEYEKLRLFSYIGRMEKVKITIPKKTKDKRGGFYACNFGEITLPDEKHKIPTYVIGYRGDDELTIGEEVSVRIIGLLNGKTDSDVVFIAQFLHNKKVYTQFEIMNLIYMQERHHERDLFLYNPEIGTPVYVNIDMNIDIEGEDFLNKLTESTFNVDADGNILIKLRQKSDFMTKYQTCHKLLKIYKATNNLEGIKHQLCKLWYMVIIIETYYTKPENVNPITRKLSEKNREEALRSKGFIMNDFTYYLKYVIENEPGFDFEEYFSGTDYHRDLVKIDSKGVFKLVKSVFSLIV